jgi:hypothetical protein
VYFVGFVRVHTIPKDNFVSGGVERNLFENSIYNDWRSRVLRGKYPALLKENDKLESSVEEFVRYTPNIYVLLSRLPYY